MVPFPHISRRRNGERIDELAQTVVDHGTSFSVELERPRSRSLAISRYLRTARDVDTTCTVRRNVHESMATKVRARRAPNLLRGCVGRSHVDHTEARNDFVGCIARSDRRALADSIEKAELLSARAAFEHSLSRLIDRRSHPVGAGCRYIPTVHVTLAASSTPRRPGASRLPG